MELENERMGKDKPIKYQEKAKIQNTISDEKELKENSVIREQRRMFDKLHISKRHYRIKGIFPQTYMHQIIQPQNLRCSK